MKALPDPNPARDGLVFVREHTRRGQVPLVPEIALYLATEITPIWQATEAWLAQHNVEPPFWAFAWPGGQALARYVLDHPACVAGRRVLDFAAGCGIAAIACALAGRGIGRGGRDRPAGACRDRAERCGERVSSHRSALPTSWAPTAAGT